MFFSVSLLLSLCWFPAGAAWRTTFIRPAVRMSSTSAVTKSRVCGLKLNAIAGSASNNMAAPLSLAPAEGRTGYGRSFFGQGALQFSAISLIGLAFLMLRPNAADASTGLSSLSNLSGLALADKSGFLQAFLLIFISEIGDKTFFIAGLLAAKYGRWISFGGSMAALGLMTIISTALGQIFHRVPASIAQGIPFDDYLAVAAFAYFGLKTLYDASQIAGADAMSGMEEEKQEAEELVKEATDNATENKRANTVLSLFLQTFSLVFAAEIGDRSFLSTIALSAAMNPLAVSVGAIVAHAVATGIAVIGGVILSKYLSEKVIGYIGGTLFIIFAVTTAMGIMK